MGTCGLPSASALMHFPRDISERLINLASSNKRPSLPEIMGQKTFVKNKAFQEECDFECT